MAILPKFIFKIIAASDWETMQTTGYYSHESLQTEGFVHFALDEQILAVANKHFSDKTDLRLIAVNTESLEAPWVMEDLKNRGVLYPHVYGKINTSAIVAVYDFDKNDQGVFELPDAIKQTNINL